MQVTQTLELGDVEGHPFRGNQWTEWTPVDPTATVIRWKGEAVLAALGDKSDSGHFSQVIMPTTLSGHKLHVYSDTPEQTASAVARVFDVAAERGLGIKVANPSFHELAKETTTQTGKGVTIYLPRKETAEEDTAAIVTAMAGWTHVKEIVGDEYVANGVSRRYELSPDAPERDLDREEYHRYYLPAAVAASAEFGDVDGHPFHGNQYTHDVLGRYDEWRANLTAAESRALAFYQSPGYVLTNEPLRGRPVNAPETDMKRARQATQDLVAAIEKAPPLEHPLTVYRAVDAADLHGNVLTDKGFMSVSLTREGATTAGSRSNERTVALTLPVGTRVAAGTVKELILPPGSRLRVASLTAAVQSLEFGDSEGHPFRGNQWTGGFGSVDAYMAAHQREPNEDLFTYQSRLVAGLRPEQQSEVLFKTRERYEPVSYLRDGINRWCDDRGLRRPPDDCNQIPVDLDEARATARYFEETSDQSDDPRVAAAYEDFKAQSAEMYDHMTRPESAGGLGVKVDFVNIVNPYPTAEAQAEDLRVNHHISIESGLGGAHEATMTRDEYDRFRAVHDVFGHAGVGGGFDRHGEYEAWLAHASMYQGEGRAAMSTEYHGVNSAAWSGEPGTPGTGKSMLLPERYANPPWDRGVTASAAGFDVDELIRRLGLDDSFAAKFDDLPWHPHAVVASVQPLELGDNEGHPFHGNQYTRSDARVGADQRPSRFTSPMGEPMTRSQIGDTMEALATTHPQISSALTKRFGGRVVNAVGKLAAGDRQGPWDLRAGNHAIELKSVHASSTTQKATLKREEIENKERAIAAAGLQPATAVIVWEPHVDGSATAHVHVTDGISAGTLRKFDEIGRYPVSQDEFMSAYCAAGYCDE